jgi:NDP-sugar pyrophosphorylase family protein
LKPEPSGINEVLYPHFMKTNPDQIRGEFIPDVYWYDTGSVPFLWATSMSLLEELAKHRHGILAKCLTEFAHYHEVKSGVWIKNGQKLPSNVTVEGPVIIGEDCTLEPGAVVGPNAVIGDHSSIAASFE